MDLNVLEAVSIKSHLPCFFFFLDQSSRFLRSGLISILQSSSLPKLLGGLEEYLENNSIWYIASVNK